MNNKFLRRDFIKQGTSVTAEALLTTGLTFPLTGSNNALQPAVLGGKPVRTKEWQTWLMWNPETDEKRVIDDIRSGIWSGSTLVTKFETEWAKAVGAKRSLAVVNATNGLIASLIQLNIGGGDEVIVPSYTFIATVDAVIATGAMPVFADIEPETFQNEEFQENVSGKYTEY